jgi:hypothetical protein
MSKIAIHPQTLDCREFKAGQDLFKLGYVVVKGVEDIPEQLSGQVIDQLVAKFSQKRVTKRSRLTILTMMWPDLVLYSLNNIAPIPGPVGETTEEQPKGFPKRFETFASSEVYDPRKPNANEMLEFTSHERTLKSPIYKTVPDAKPGRGNHKPRLPVFQINVVNPIPSMCPQASILAFELQKVVATGKTIMTMADVPIWLKTINLATVQDPMRIFRYYFWLLVRTGVIEPLQYASTTKEEELRVASIVSQEK